MTGGFLMLVITVVLAIVIAAPQYADPVAGAGDAAPADELTPVAPDEPEAAPAAVVEKPTSKLPHKLKGYRWPVRGGSIARYYQAHPKGDFQIDGVRMHDGIVITWFEGAAVKSAHNGTVVAAGRDWADHVGFNDSLRDVYKRFAPIDDSKAARKSKKPRFPQGIVIDDGNGYYSVYTEIKDLLVRPGETVKVGQPIAGMAAAEGMEMLRYRLVRMDGPMMRVHDAARDRGYPNYARERVDPLAVLGSKAKKQPLMKRERPTDPPRLSEY